MPTDSVYIVITIPNKEYERELRKFKLKNNFNNTDDIISTIRKHKELEVSFEKVLADTLEELQIDNAAWTLSGNGNYYQVCFSCELCENDAILNILKSKGIGTKAETSVGFIPFNLFFAEEDSDNEDTFSTNYGTPSEMSGKKLNQSKKANVFKEATNDFLKSVTSRLTVAQVVEGVKSGAEITFDFTVYTLMAAFIASFGLFDNDPVNIAASMMIEPVMGTVMAMTFGLVIHDKQLFWMGVKNNIISLLMCLIPGYIIGMIFFIWMTEWNPPPNGIWPTPQMQGRGTYEGLIYGVMIALPCGGAVAVSLLNSNYGALVGVAVASTFQPPFLNAGLEYALATHLHIRGLWQQTVPYNISGGIYYLKPAWAPQEGYIPVYSYDMRKENALLGCVSLALTAVNVVSMLITAYITLKIKEVMPLEKLELISPGSQRFFKNDLKVAREYNRKHSADPTEEPLGRRILSEWAEVAGIDKKSFLNMTPEARITQLQTLFDIIKDVETDETFKRVTRDSNNHIGLARRLTRSFIKSNHDENPKSMQNPAIWNIEQEIARAIHSGRYDLNGNGDTSRIVNDSNQSSPYSTFGYSAGVNIKPSDVVAERGRRKSSQLLRQSVKYKTSSPYSVWPVSQAQNKMDTFDIYDGFDRDTQLIHQSLKRRGN